MSKFLTVSVVIFLAALTVVGCSKKESAESTDMTMPMSVSVESTSPSTNIITKAGAPVETSAPAQQPTVSQPMSEAIPVATSTYTPPSAQDIQQALKNAGLYKGSVDGKIGPGTKRAITEFQQQNGLTADGKVGKKTWEKRKEHLNQTQQ